MLKHRIFSYHNCKSAHTLTHSRTQSGKWLDREQCVGELMALAGGSHSDSMSSPLDHVAPQVPKSHCASHRFSPFRSRRARLLSPSQSSILTHQVPSPWSFMNLSEPRLTPPLVSTDRWLACKSRITKEFQDHFT